MKRKRSEIEREQDTIRALDLYLNGKNLTQIAAVINEGRDPERHILGVQVCKDISNALKVWRERYLGNIDVVFARELNRLEALESEYWRAWQSSYEASVDTDVAEIVQNDRESGEQVVQKESRTRKRTRRGNPEYLKGIERVIELRYKLMGLGQTRTVNVNWRTEAVKSGIDPDSVIDAIVTQLVDAAQSVPEKDLPLIASGEEDDYDDDSKG